MTALQAEGCGGALRVQIVKKGGAPSVISTKALRSGEIPPLMVRAALRWEISGLRVSSKRFPSAPYRHASPLEMTILASAPLVISTEAKRSGEISLHHGTGSIGVGDLSTQSFIKAFSICPIPTCISARDDDIGGHPYRHFDRSGAEWRNLTPQWTKKGCGFRRWLFRRAALPSLRSTGETRAPMSQCIQDLFPQGV